MASFECKQVILAALAEHQETNITGVHYVVNEYDEEGGMEYTIEVTDFSIRMPDDSVEVETSFDHNQALTDDLNDLLFNFIEEFNGEEDDAEGEIEL